MDKYAKSTINISGISLEPDYYSEIEFIKAVEANNWLIFTDEDIQSFDSDVESLIKKAETSYISQEEKDILEKAQRDRSKLVQKQVVDKNGKRTTKWVKRGDNVPEPRKKDEHGRDAETGYMEGTPNHHVKLAMNQLGNGLTLDKLVSYLKGRGVSLADIQTGVYNLRPEGTKTIAMQGTEVRKMVEDAYNKSAENKVAKHENSGMGKSEADALLASNMKFVGTIGSKLVLVKYIEKNRSGRKGAEYSVMFDDNGGLERVFASSKNSTLRGANELRQALMASGVDKSYFAEDINKLASKKPIEDNEKMREVLKKDGADALPKDKIFIVRYYTGREYSGIAYVGANNKKEAKDHFKQSEPADYARQYAGFRIGGAQSVSEYCKEMQEYDDEFDSPEAMEEDFMSNHKQLPKKIGEVVDIDFGN